MGTRHPKPSRPTRLTALLVLVVGSSAALAQPAPEPQPDLCLLMISIDGLNPEYLRQADRWKLKIPNLRGLLEAGAHASSVRSVFPTLTYACHATLLTGVSPARHGILANAPFDPLEKNKNGWYWYAEDIQATTLWEAATRKGWIAANVHWPTSVGAPVTFNLPQYWRTGTPQDRKLLRALATPGLLKALEEDLGPYADGLDDGIAADETRARFMIALIERERPRLMTAYLASLDHEQHMSGPFSAESLATLERLDTLVGGLAAAERRSCGERAVLTVVSDHGLIPVKFKVKLSVAFRREKLITYGTNNNPIAWQAAPWPMGATAAVIQRDPADAEVRRRVKDLIRRLASDPANGIERVLERPELGRLGGFADADQQLILRPGYALDFASTGKVVEPASQRGAHGYPPDNPGMNAIFILAGPRVPAGKDLGDIDLRDVAPTLAHLVGLELGSAEGRDVLTPGSRDGRSPSSTEPAASAVTPK